MMYKETVRVTVDLAEIVEAWKQWDDIIQRGGKKKLPTKNSTFIKINL